MFEIERKFLVSGSFLPFAVSYSRIVQGYICSARGRTVPVRIRGEKGYLTISGRVNRNFFMEKFCYGKTERRES